MSYDKFNKKVLDNLTDEDKIIYTPLTRWRRRLDAPTDDHRLQLHPNNYFP